MSRFFRHLRLARLADRAKDEGGAVAIIVGLFLVALLVLAALVLDMGNLYDHDRDLQSAADAAALAGAQQIIYNSAGIGASQDPAQTARDYVSTNANVSSVVEANLAAWAPVVDATSVTVDLRENSIPFWFATVIGHSEGSVHAHAKAEVKYLTGLRSVFPVALLMMNPDHFHFIIKSPDRSTVTSFDLENEKLGETDDEGFYDHGGTSFTPSQAGLYTITLQTHDGDHNVGFELADIGLWRAADSSDSEETVYKVGLSRPISSNTITVRVETAASVTDATLSGTLGSSFTLSRQGDGTYLGTVPAPQSGNAKDGYATFDLEIKALSKDSLARYIAFNRDVPLEYLMFVPGQYSGYSGLVGQSASVSAVVKTRVYTFGDSYTMKLGNQEGSGLYSGNWRAADVYLNVNARDEVATIDPPSSWQLVYPLRIGGPLLAEPGVAVGQWIQGLEDRLNDTRFPEDVRRTVIVPMVDWDTSIRGSDEFRIQSFAAFYIDSFSTSGTGKGDCVGHFIEWVAPPGDWQDEPPGPLYLETVVLTE